MNQHVILNRPLLTPPFLVLGAFGVTAIAYNPDVCIGCRTCMTGCPYNVPQYDYDNALGKIHKCEMCNQKGVERTFAGPCHAETAPRAACLRAWP